MLSEKTKNIKDHLNCLLCIEKADEICHNIINGLMIEFPSTPVLTLTR